jgi:hypothetical protein
MKTGALFILIAMLAITLNANAGQTTNSVNLTTNLIFSLTTVGNDDAGSQFKSDQKIQYLFTGTSTNFVYFRRFPSGNFDFHLFDESGNELQKSKAGFALTDNPRKPTLQELKVEDLKFAGCILDNEMAIHNDLFRPDEIFLITNKGNYELEVRARICVIMTNGLPDYNAFLDGRNSVPSGYPFAKDFGILESVPLRVKIIKE